MLSAVGGHGGSTSGSYTSGGGDVTDLGYMATKAPQKNGYQSLDVLDNDLVTIEFGAGTTLTRADSRR